MRSPAMPLVLVVDDATQIRRLVRLTLEHRAHRVLEAEDGIVGLRTMRAERPDLVVMDVTMPGPSGLDVLREMRADPALAATPVIILTAGGQAASEELAVEAGATAYMDKPFSPAALLALVASLLGD
jgi:two-component system chemotaxis response regulator CheY